MYNTGRKCDVYVLYTTICRIACVRFVNFTQKSAVSDPIARPAYVILGTFYSRVQLNHVFNI